MKYKEAKKEDFAELPYSEVDGVILTTGRDTKLLVGGIVLVVLGLALKLWALALIGIGAIGLYLYKTSVFYEFFGRGLDRKTRKWRMLDTESEEVQDFVRQVRAEIAKRKRNRYNPT